MTETGGVDSQTLTIESELLQELRKLALYNRRALHLRPPGSTQSMQAQLSLRFARER